MSSLANVQQYFTRYGMSSYLLLGNIGNFMNIILFSRRNYRNNSCALYLLAASVINLFIINYGVIPTLYSIDHINPETYSIVFCKLRLYFLHSALMISRSLIVLACIDRAALCSSSEYIRLLCRRQIALRLIVCVFLAWPIIAIHIPILLTIQSGQCLTSGLYGLIYSIYSFVVAGLLPPTLMIIFGCITIHSLHSISFRVRQNNHHASRIHKNDYYLMVMLMSEVIVYLISTLPYPMQTLYLTVTSNTNKSTLHLQIQSFLTYMSYSFLIYINSASTFYIYICTSPAFRKQCKRLIDRFWHQIAVPTVVHPISYQQHFTPS